MCGACFNWLLSNRSSAVHDNTYISSHRHFSFSHQLSNKIPFSSPKFLAPNNFSPPSPYPICHSFFYSKNSIYARLSHIPMGCATSKLDDLPAVALCRERCAFLDEALRLRFALADAHAAYLQSLKEVSISMHTFFIQDLDASAHRPLSPVLNLPPQRKGDPHGHSSSSSENIHHLHSHSDSGSHLHFDSDSDDEEADSLHNNQVSSPVRNQQSYAGYIPAYENLNFNFPGTAAGGGGGFMHINYMKNQATPSVVHTQLPMTPKTWHMDEPSASASSFYPYPSYQEDINRNPNPSSYTNYSGYPSNPNFGAGGGGFYGRSSAAPAYGGGFSSQPAAASSFKAPPSPPRSSGWDFLNPFDGFEKFYPATTSSRDSRDVREEEGIPDLEDEDDEVVKEVLGHQKFVDSGRSSYSKPGVSEADVQEANDAQLQYRSRPRVEMNTVPVEYEVHMVDKKVVGADDRSKDQGNASGFKPRGGLKGDLEVVREIQVQFERASESGSELSKFLEVGKLPYKRRHGVNHVSSKMLHLPVLSSQPSTSKGSDMNMADPAYLNADQELETRSRILSSTLHKLYLWEKKLYEEVKAEEKMRVLHDRKSRKLKHLDERGAEVHKLDATRTLVRSLSTKIRIAIQVVDRISVKINNLRDEELWLQLNDLIQGLTTMWKSMLECHRSQCQAIGEAKRLDAIAFRKHFSDAHFEATRQFEHDLVNWTLRFSSWVDAQKGFVRALNSWLRNCLLYVPEETADGIVPFSPGRIGAPPVFVVCNQWWQSLERISEKEVVGSMRDFASNVLQLWDRDKAEMRQKMLANKDDRKIKSLDREDQKIQKEILALDKRIILLNSTNDNGMPSTGHAVYQSETTKGGSLQASLQHVLEAMEGFTSNSLKVYEELLQRIEEEHLAREHGRVS